MKYLLIIFLFLILIIPTNAQFQKIKLTGNLQTDSEILFEENKTESLAQISFQLENKKSPFLAGLFSLVVPGSGQFYAESYWKAAIFLTVEAAAITTAIIYNGKGDDQTAKFEKYADENWSVVKYAEWLNTQRGAQITIDYDTPNLKPWERVNWSELNAAESSFSHRLHRHGEQQYYELIGKYAQYSPGWAEFNPDEPDYHKLPPQFTFYSGMRGKANDYYNVASKAVIGIYVNHFLSALDAVWTTSQYNSSLAVKMRLEQIQLVNKVELIPTLKLSFNF